MAPFFPDTVYYVTCCSTCCCPCMWHRHRFHLRMELKRLVSSTVMKTPMLFSTRWQVRFLVARNIAVAVRYLCRQVGNQCHNMICKDMLNDIKTLLTADTIQTRVNYVFDLVPVLLTVNLETECLAFIHVTVSTIYSLYCMSSA